MRKKKEKREYLGLKMDPEVKRALAVIMASECVKNINITKTEIVSIALLEKYNRDFANDAANYRNQNNLDDKWQPIPSPATESVAQTQ